jgi:hypothetical protein
VYSPAFPRPPRISVVVVDDEIEILATLQLSAIVTAAAAAAAGTPPPPPLPSLRPPSAVVSAVVSPEHEYTMP